MWPLSLLAMVILKQPGQSLFSGLAVPMCSTLALPLDHSFRSNQEAKFLPSAHFLCESHLVGERESLLLKIAPAFSEHKWSCTKFRI